MNPCPARNPIRHLSIALAFTLIELLVVITIIVVLLALLTPALDRAIYMSELVTCAAQQRGLGQASQQYAMGNRRRFPDRSAPYGQMAYWANTITWPNVNIRYDLRKLMADYASGQLHMDPMSEQVTMKDTAADDDTYILSSYMLFFGWRYNYGGATKGMERIGDRWTWRELAGVDKNANGVVDSYQFDILLGDFDYDAIPASWVFIGSHPDSEGYLSTESLQDDDSAQASALIQGHPGGRFTLSRWALNAEGAGPAGTTRNPNAYRGTFDQNFTFADGSTLRFNHVGQMDERMVYVGLAEIGAHYMQVVKP